jgi:hypothetical protein
VFTIKAEDATVKLIQKCVNQMHIPSLATNVPAQSSAGGSAGKRGV